jgi:hypothetical protein
MSLSEIQAALPTLSVDERASLHEALFALDEGISVEEWRSMNSALEVELADPSPTSRRGLVGNFGLSRPKCRAGSCPQLWRAHPDRMSASLLRPRKGKTPCGLSDASQNSRGIAQDFLPRRIRPYRDSSHLGRTPGLASQFTVLAVRTYSLDRVLMPLVMRWRGNWLRRFCLME